MFPVWRGSRRRRRSPSPLQPRNYPPRVLPPGGPKGQSPAARRGAAKGGRGGRGGWGGARGRAGGRRAGGLGVMNSHRMRAVGTRGGRVEGQRRCLQTGGDVIRASLGSVLAFAVLFAVGAVVTPARAQTTNWTGATGDWFTSGN